MADEHGHSGPPELEFGGQGDDNGDLNTGGFIFTSSAEPGQTMQALVTSVPSSVFSLEDMTSSTANGISVVRSVSNDSVGVLKDTIDSTPGFTLVGGEDGEFMVVPGDPAVSEGPGGGGGTITLNLDEATQFLLRQQGITQAVELADGSFQILENPGIQAGDDGPSLPMEVIHALQGELPNSLTAGEFHTPDTLVSMQPHDSHEHIKTENPENGDDVDDGDVESGASFADDMDPVTVKSEEVEDDRQHMVASSENKVKKPDKRVTVKKEAPIKKEKEAPDLSQPIPLSDQTIITIKGKKCVLAFNQETQQVCAYPLKANTGGKRRGRPKLTEEEKAALAERRRQEAAEDRVKVTGEEQSSAAETLLELSNTGGDGVRRSGRKRKKAKLLEEYEELEDSGEDEPFTDNQDKDPDISINLPDIKRKKLTLNKETENRTMMLNPLPNSVPQPVKRGRGRPRRYPPPNRQPATSIPAVMIPSANGQTTLLMTQVQGFQNLQNLLPIKPLDDNPVTMAMALSATTTTTTSDGGDTHPLPLSTDSDSLPLDTSAVLDSNNIIPSALQGDTIPLDGEEADDGTDIIDASASMVNFSLDAADKVIKDSTSLDNSDGPGQPTVIQIPDNLLPMLGFKKDPIKIGLKASERELEKLKCPKCDFQGYYSQQYRQHIATHGDDIHKCKCCSYLSLDEEELLAHFREFHPRCICIECGYMAEHAYIIKRHMMRHDTASCTCNLCGKVYKDMYILKMHVKMVHMPADVLFECSVCSKKFTRKAHLKRHLRIHDPEKPFKCMLCDYRGCERSDISKHMLIHEDPKHACERCGKTFRHIKNKELHVKRHYGQRDYKCGVCDFFGYTFTDIRKHIERKHQDIKMLICDKCNKHFRSEYALKEHQATCNVMMIEQVLAIPTSSGGTSQATIQIPATLGQDQHIVLDTGQQIAVNNSGQLNIMVTEQNLGMVGIKTEEEDEVEEEEEETASMTQAMHMIGDTIMTDGGQEVQILGSQSLGPGARLISQAELERMMASEGMVCTSEGDGTPQVLEMVSQNEGEGSASGRLPQMLVAADGQVVHQFIHPGVEEEEEEEELGKEEEEEELKPEPNEDSHVNSDITETDLNNLDGDV